MKTFKQVFEILIMLFQTLLAFIPFCCGFLFVIIKAGWLSGVKASEELIDYFAE